jgi:hypothetical protein
LYSRPSCQIESKAFLSLSLSLSLSLTLKLSLSLSVWGLCKICHLCVCSLVLSVGWSVLSMVSWTTSQCVEPLNHMQSYSLESKRQNWF